MQPESCFLSKQGVKKARTGITGCCSLTVRGASIPLRPCPDPLSCDIAPMSPLNRNHPSLSPLQSSPSQKAQTPTPHPKMKSRICIGASELKQVTGVKHPETLNRCHLRPYLTMFDAGSLYLDPTRGKVLWVLLFRHLVSTHFVLLGNVVLCILVTRLHFFTI